MTAPSKYKYKLEVKVLQKPLKVPAEKLEEFKGVFSKRVLSRLKKEAVECPLKGSPVSFLECFVCDKFIRRVKGYVYCSG
ncbi:hypothetical protein DRO30_02405 [Candidatus Bathyarchaeota archaeon]|nr:MAG: hypothetical protein DRO30_02405 [Candidatus Bathyarchaeota archaeon]